MTQWGHAQPEEGARANNAARTAMWIAVWSVLVAFVMFCAVSEALADTYRAHPHRGVPHYSTAHYVTHHSKAHARTTGIPAGRTTAHEASLKGSQRASARAPKFEPVKETSSSRRASARERHSAQPASPSMHRVSGHRRSGERQPGSQRLDVVSAASARPPVSGVYSNGVAHPDQAASLPKVSAEASSALSGPAPLQRSAPSDLVGAPLTATQSEAHSTTSIVNGGAPVATHAELAEEAAQPVVLPGLYRFGRLVVPPPMRGTREILVHQNLIADEEGLTRIQDDDDLRRMRADRMLVDFPESSGLRVNSELGSERRCARPWAVRFAEDIGRSYYARFHEPLQVNSAVRTVAYQVRLRRVNGNAAGIDGDVASPHLTGEALDFGKHGMSKAEVAWMRLYLGPLMHDGKLDVEEEFQQACFHISVYRKYAPDMPVRRKSPRSDLAKVQTPLASASQADGDQ